MSTTRPGRSLYVRLRGPESGPGAAGRWTDAATGEYGDLLDLIASNRGIGCFRDICDEAQRFLALPYIVPRGASRVPGAPRGSQEAAQRLFRLGVPVPGTRAETYLRARGITAPLDWASLRFHPALWYRADAGAARQSWPGLLAAVTDPQGSITGVHRTWLDPVRPRKAPLPDPRRALGSLLGNGVRFGRARDVLLAGEGIETVLSLKSVLPAMPMIAALSASHLAALAFTPALKRLYVARDNDEAGCRAAERLRARGEMAGIEVLDLVPVLEDFNEDLRRCGHTGLSRQVEGQLSRAQVSSARFAAVGAQVSAR